MHRHFIDTVQYINYNYTYVCFAWRVWPRQGRSGGMVHLWSIYTPLVHVYDVMEDKQHRSYLGRYYILAAISLLAAQQNLSWASFGPIAEEAWQYYGLTDIQVTLLPGT